MSREQPFRTLLQEEQEKRAQRTIPYMIDADKDYVKEREKYRGCPHLDEHSICEPSRKFRLRPFPCNGFMYQTCQIYIFIKNNQGDPEVLAKEL